MTGNLRRWVTGGVALVTAAALLGSAGVDAFTPNLHAMVEMHNARLAGKQCCGEDLTMKRHKHQCSDGSKINLECDVMFLLDKEENEDDAYEIRPDGTLLLANVSIHDFCMARMSGGASGAVPGLPHNVAVVCHHHVGDPGDPGDPGDSGDPRPQWWFDVASALSWLSVACLALTLLAHCLLRELRDLQGRCHMGAVASLGLGLLALAILQGEAFDRGAFCTTMAFLVYYWLLSAFFWLNVTSFNVWRSVVLEHIRFRERTLFICYSTVSWGVPVVLLGFLLTAHMLPEDYDGIIVRPKFGTNKCWFHDDHATWAWFYWPLAVLLGMNIVYFVWTTAHLWRQYGNAGNAGNAGTCRRKLMWRRFLLSLKLFLIMGISWTFELISSAADVPGNAAWYLTDTFNAMQGVVILLVLVVTRRRVWRALYRRRPCGFRPPQQWAYPSGDGDGSVPGGDEEGTSTDSDDDLDEPVQQELKDMTTNGHAVLKQHRRLSSS